MIAFGPVPSRRLGRSLGVNNIPPKICTYSCAYCQLGRTIKMQAERQRFYEPDRILREVRDKVEKAQKKGEAIDYLTVVPDGEPTLDINLGQEIEDLKSLGIKVAVISNASLVWDPEVREALAKADWVSLKADAATEKMWQRVNRPHGKLQLDPIQDGMLTFAEEYEGVLATETMLVTDLNDGQDTIRDVADFLALLRPDLAYLSIPTRPPAEPWAQPPGEEAINRAYQIISEKVDHVEYLIGYEGNEFAFTGDVEDDLLSITSVHPMREDAVRDFLKRAEGDWEAVRRLVAQDQLIEVRHGGRRFYLRKLNQHGKA
ncbi:MAG: radical SAM protein [Anaerolineae bacterium]|nr:radical SAM protein [Anaerolineae bacterium]